MGLLATAAAWMQGTPRVSAVEEAVNPQPTDRQETRWRGASRGLRSLANWLPWLGSPTGDLPTHELQIMRARSRDAFRGHPVARAALTRCRTNIVGTGLICRPAVDCATLGLSEEEGQELNGILLRFYEAWAEDPAECDAESTLDIYGLQALTLLSSMTSGDVFALTVMESRPGGTSEIKVQLIEADRISNPNNAVDTTECTQGVQIEGSRPVGFWIRDTHPGDRLKVSTAKWTYYSAFGAKTGRRRVLHVWNDKERPGQLRGAPYLAPVLEPLKQIERYSGAELTAAVVSAMFTVFIERDKELAFDENGDPVTTMSDSADSVGNIELGNGAVVDLLPGEKANSTNPGRPNANFDPFFMAVVKQIGAALELPVDELLLHYQSSYSAARAAMLQAWRFYTTRRWTLTQQFCQPLYSLVLDEGVASGRLRLPGYGDPVRRRAYSRALWIGPARGAMDELREAQAAAKRIETGVSNEAMETAAMTGEDWDAVQTQRAREIARRRELGTWPPTLQADSKTNEVVE